MRITKGQLRKLISESIKQIPGLHITAMATIATSPYAALAAMGNVLSTAAVGLVKTAKGGSGGGGETKVDVNVELDGRVFEDAVIKIIEKHHRAV
mgnify:CR=1 FL=1